MEKEGEYLEVSTGCLVAIRGRKGVSEAHMMLDMIFSLVLTSDGSDGEGDQRFALLVPI